MDASWVPGGHTNIPRIFLFHVLHAPTAPEAREMETTRSDFHVPRMTEPNFSKVTSFVSSYGISFFFSFHDAYMTEAVSLSRVSLSYLSAKG